MNRRLRKICRKLIIQITLQIEIFQFIHLSPSKTYFVFIYMDIFGLYISVFGFRDLNLIRTSHIERNIDTRIRIRFRTCIRCHIRTHFEPYTNDISLHNMYQGVWNVYVLVF